MAVVVCGSQTELGAIKDCGLCAGYEVGVNGVLFFDPTTGLQALRTLLFSLVLLLSDLQSAKAFAFNNQSSPDFAYTLSTITP